MKRKNDQNKKVSKYHQVNPEHASSEADITHFYTYSPYGEKSTTPSITGDDVGPDDVHHISALQLEYVDNTSATRAQIYGNGWNQVAVRVRAVLLGQDGTTPVILNAEQLISCLTCLDQNQQTIARQKPADTQVFLSYWNSAGVEVDGKPVGTFTKAIYQVEEKPAAIEFVKPVSNSLTRYDTVELEIRANGKGDKNIKQLIVSYNTEGVNGGKDIEIEHIDYNENKISWNREWALPAGNLTLKAMIVDEDGEKYVIEKKLAIPLPEDRSWVHINNISDSQGLNPGASYVVDVSYQVKKWETLFSAMLAFDGKTIGSQNNLSGQFLGRKYSITMPEYTTKLNARLFTWNSEQQNHTINLHPQQTSKSSRENISSVITPQESTAVLYFSSADGNQNYELNAQLKFTHANGTTLSPLKMVTAGAINYSDTNQWCMDTNQPETDREYFDSYIYNAPQAWFTVKEFRLYAKNKPNNFSFSIKECGETLKGGYLGPNDYAWVDLSRPVSALTSWGGEQLTILSWAVISKPHDVYGANVGYRHDGTSEDYSAYFCTNAKYVDKYQAVTMYDAHEYMDKSVPPYDYISIYRIRINQDQVNIPYPPEIHAYGWDDYVSDSHILVADDYGNHATITVQYKYDSWDPIFPPR